MIFAMLFWGGSWVSSKYVTQTCHPQVASFIRFFLTFLAFFPMMFFFKQSFILNRIQFFRILMSSFLMVAYFQLFFFGLSIGLAGIGGVIVTGLNPLFIFLLSLVFFHKKTHLKEIFALFFGLAGTLLILQIWQISYERLVLNGNLFYLIAAVTWAFVTLSSQYAQEKVSLWVYSFYLYFFSTLIQFFFALPYSIPGSLSQNTSFWLNMAYLALLPSIFSNTVYFYAASSWGSKKTGFFTFLVPFASIFFSFVFLGESPALFTLFGGGLVIFAVYLIQSKK